MFADLGSARMLAVRVAAVAGLLLFAGTASADNVTRYPSQNPCYCDNYTGAIYWSVVTGVRPCSITVVWGPWVGTGVANWNNGDAVQGPGQKFIVRMEKTSRDNVPMTFYFPDGGTTIVNGPFKTDPSFHTWPTLTLSWRAR